MENLETFGLKPTIIGSSLQAAATLALPKTLLKRTLTEQDGRNDDDVA